MNIRKPFQECNRHCVGNAKQICGGMKENDEENKDLSSRRRNPLSFSSMADSIKKK